jgi:hypothetical protein
MYLFFKTYNTLSIRSSLNFNRFDTPGNSIVHFVKSKHGSQEVPLIDLRCIVNFWRYLNFVKFTIHGDPIPQFTNLIDSRLGFNCLNILGVISILKSTISFKDGNWYWLKGFFKSKIWLSWSNLFGIFITSLFKFDKSHRVDNGSEDTIWYLGLIMRQWIGNEFLTIYHQDDK